MPSHISMLICALWRKQAGSWRLAVSLSALFALSCVSSGPVDVCFDYTAVSDLDEHGQTVVAYLWAVSEEGVQAFETSVKTPEVGTNPLHGDPPRGVLRVEPETEKLWQRELRVAPSQSVEDEEYKLPAGSKYLGIVAGYRNPGGRVYALIPRCSSIWRTAVRFDRNHVAVD